MSSRNYPCINLSGHLQVGNLLNIYILKTLCRLDNLSWRDSNVTKLYVRILHLYYEAGDSMITLELL